MLHPPLRRSFPLRSNRAGALLLPILALSSLAHGQDPVEPPKEAETTTRWYDLRAFSALELEEPEGVDMRLTLDSFPIDQLEPDGYDLPLEGTETLDTDRLIEVVLDALGDDWIDSGVLVDSRGGFLFIEGTEATHAEVQRILDEVFAALMGQVLAEVYELPGTTQVPGSVLTSAQADALLAAGAAELVSRSTVRIATREQIGETSHRALLYDYDVEVAQGSNVTDPIVTVLSEGLEVGLHVLPEQDGRLFARVWGRRGQLEKVREVQLPALDDAVLQLPRAHSTLCAASATLEDGGALVLGRLGGDAPAWLIRLRGIEGTTAQTQGWIHPGRLCAAPLLAPPVWVPFAGPSGGWEVNEEHWIEQLGLNGDPVLPLDELSSMLWDIRDLQGLEGTPVQIGAALWLPDSPELLEQGRRLVSELGASLGGATAEVEIRLGTLPRSTLSAALAGDLDALAASLPTQLMGATRLGDSLLIVDGEEEIYLQDHDVEIAQSAAILDPQAARTFDGVAAWARFTAGRGDALTAWFDVTYQEVVDTGKAPVLSWVPNLERSPLDSEMPLPLGVHELNSELELRATRRATLRVMAHLRPDTWCVVGSCGVGATDRSMVVLARARPRP